MPRRRRRGIVAPFPDFRMWDEKELTNIKGLIEQAHQPRYNPHNLKLPTGNDGSPLSFVRTLRQMTLAGSFFSGRCGHGYGPGGIMA